MSKITREALLHIPRSNYCYGYDENTLHIRLRAKKGEVKSAFLRIGDQYIWDELEGGGGNLGSGGKVWILQDSCFQIFQEAIHQSSRDERPYSSPGEKPPRRRIEQGREGGGA